MKLEVFRGKLRLRFTHNKRRFSLTFGENNSENLKLAKASLIRLKADLKQGNFDNTLDSYRLQRLEMPLEIFPIAHYFSQWLLIFGKTIPYNLISTQRMIEKWDIKLASELPYYLIRQSLSANTFNNRLNILKRFAKWLVKSS